MAPGMSGECCVPSAVVRLETRPVAETVLGLVRLWDILILSVVNKHSKYHKTFLISALKHQQYWQTLILGFWPSPVLSLRVRTKGLGKRSLSQHLVVTLGLLLRLWLPLEKHYDWQTLFRLRGHVSDSRLWSRHPQCPGCWYRGPLGLPQLRRGPGDAGRAGQWPGWQARAPKCQVRRFISMVRNTGKLFVRNAYRCSKTPTGPLDHHGLVSYIKQVGTILQCQKFTDNFIRKVSPALTKRIESHLRLG